MAHETGPDSGALGTLRGFSTCSEKDRKTVEAKVKRNNMKNFSINSFFLTTVQLEECNCTFLKIKLHIFCAISVYKSIKVKYSKNKYHLTFIPLFFSIFNKASVRIQGPVP